MEGTYTVEIATALKNAVASDRQKTIGLLGEQGLNEKDANHFADTVSKYSAEEIVDRFNAMMASKDEAAEPSGANGRLALAASETDGLRAGAIMAAVWLGLRLGTLLVGGYCMYDAATS